MGVEAVPIRFEPAGAVVRAAERINKELKRGRYVGHILVADNPTKDNPLSSEGVVLLIEIDDGSEQPSGLKRTID